MVSPRYPQWSHFFFCDFCCGCLYLPCFFLPIYLWYITGYNFCQGFRPTGFGVYVTLLPLAQLSDCSAQQRFRKKITCWENMRRFYTFESAKFDNFLFQCSKFFWHQNSRVTNNTL
jgi:hypothetical protein